MMELHDLIHPPTKSAWTARLVLFIAVVVVVIVVTQYATLFLS